MKKSFTLIELLIVIGILSVLVVTILITLNPAEAQKKARDVKRIKDATTVQSIIEQYINDGNVPICTPTKCLSTDNSSGVNCSNSPTNWLNKDLSKYCSTLPVDPRNGQSATIVTGGSVASPNTQVVTSMYYALIMDGSNYEINVRQESKSNADKVLNDGGGANTTDDAWVELGSNINLR